MPQAIRVIDRVKELSDWDQSTFSDGFFVIYDALTQTYVGTSVAPGGGGNQIIQTGLNTSAAPGSGYFCYVSSNSTLAYCTSSSMLASNFIGVNTGVSGEMIMDGIVLNAQFTTAGGSPTPGQVVWLANSSDDSGTGAGKLTATAPTVPPYASGTILAIVGICLDNSNYGAFKTCKIVIQSKAPVALF